jgi:uncharacterized protein (DUF433 family)
MRAAGATNAGIMAEYDYLNWEDTSAALDYAARANQSWCHMT